MKIYLGTDHRGFKLKERIIRWLDGQDYEVEDVGATTYDENDDYPVYAEKLGSRVSSDTGSMGVLLCGSGAGAVAAVNKIRGIRASVGLSPEQVRAGRHDDDLNVLVIAADFTEEKEARKMIESFLKTSFDTTQQRYQRRINQIKELENG